MARFTYSPLIPGALKTGNHRTTSLQVTTVLAYVLTGLVGVVKPWFYAFIISPCLTEFGEIQGSYSDSEGEVLEEDEECSGEEEEDIDCVVGSAADQNAISTEVQNLAMGRRVTPLQVDLL